MWSLLRDLCAEVLKYSDIYAVSHQSSVESTARRRYFFFRIDQEITVSSTCGQNWLLLISVNGLLFAGQAGSRLESGMVLFFMDILLSSSLWSRTKCNVFRSWPCSLSHHLEVQHYAHFMSPFIQIFNSFLPFLLRSWLSFANADDTLQGLSPASHVPTEQLYSSTKTVQYASSPKLTLLVMSASNEDTKPMAGVWLTP